MSDGAAIRNFLSRASVRRRWLILGTSLVETWFGGSLLTLAAIVGAELTQRGDLAAPLWSVGVLALLAVRLGQAFSQIRAETGSPRRCAAQIGQTRRSLGPGPGDDRQLRRAIEGAFGLLEGRGHLGSPELANAYLCQVAGELTRHNVSPWRAFAPLQWIRLAVLSGLASVALLAIALAPMAAHGWILLSGRIDGRSPPPVGPVWSSLTVTLDYPAHVHRPPQVLPNPSGVIRAPAGTQIELQFISAVSAKAGTVTITRDIPDGADAAGIETIALETALDPLSFRGTFVLKSSGTWQVVLRDAIDGDETCRSPLRMLELEPDQPPAVSITGPAATEGAATDTQSVDVQWHATDDHGLSSVALVYQGPDGTAHVVERFEGIDTTKSDWHGHTTWDLAAIPLDQRDEVLYWIEARDNDPSVATNPPNERGKPARSAVMRLQISDEQQEHADNLTSLRELRDAALDLLAERMGVDERRPHRSIGDLARVYQQHHNHLERFLAQLATMTDRLSVDALAQDRDSVELAAVHQRLMRLYEVGRKLQPALQALSGPTPAAAATVTMRQAAKTNARTLTQLEDEIIRLDDLVDGLLVAQIEVLVARLETTQQKLIDLLERVKAGDQTARLQIEQLEQRRSEDLRRLSEFRALLRQEVEEDFLNVDAFSILDQMRDDDSMTARLARGEVDLALERARQELDQVSRLRSDVQERAVATTPNNPLSEEERARIALLRELSQLHDEQSGTRGMTSQLREQWRREVGTQTLSPQEAAAVIARAQALQTALKRINDANLGRDGRRGLADARAESDNLRRYLQDTEPAKIDVLEALHGLRDGLDAAVAGADTTAPETRPLRQLQATAQRLYDQVHEGLSDLSRLQNEALQHQAHDLATRQAGLRERTEQLLANPQSDPLPAEGRRALRSASAGMADSLRGMTSGGFFETLSAEHKAIDGLRRAMDSLRRGSPPPPAASRGAASTEADRDRGLRDELMDAMDESPPEKFMDATRRYYEELLH